MKWRDLSDHTGPRFVGSVGRLLTVHVSHEGGAWQLWVPGIGQLQRRLDARGPHQAQAEAEGIVMAELKRAMREVRG